MSAPRDSDLLVKGRHVIGMDFRSARHRISSRFSRNKGGAATSIVTVFVRNGNVVNCQPKSRMFTPHPNLGTGVNHNIAKSEIEGGVLLAALQPSTILHIETQNHRYTAVYLGGSEALISGHPKYCPEPVQVAITGSTWGGSMIKQRYIGRGMHLEFSHPDYQTPIITSRIQEIREFPS